MAKEKNQAGSRKWFQYPEHKFTIDIEDNEKKDVQKVIFVFGKDEKSKDKSAIIKEIPYFKAAPSEISEIKGSFYIGLGPFEEIDVERLSAVFLKTAKKIVTGFENAQVILPENIYEKFSIKQISNLLVTAFGIASYPVDLLKEKPSLDNIILKKLYITAVSGFKKEFQNETEYYKKQIDHVNGMRQLQVLPANYITPDTMEERAKVIADKYNLKLKVINETELKKMGAGGILAVCQGSVQKPRMIILEYNPAGANKKTPVLGLVGKGVTFDSGGISLKPGDNMHEMKMDMSGAAAVMHAVASIASLKHNVRIIAAVGVVENMPSGTAFKPGDVYKSLKGLTIEVQNTDAEGRLVLGDVLHYVEKTYKPNMIVDAATLTGACIVALGNHYAGIFSENEKAIEALKEASKLSLEPVWPLPIDRQYKEMLKSDIADYNNIGGRYGGASSAAAFLSLFLEKETLWAHIDIAGTAILNKEHGLYTKEAAGYGVRLLTAIAENMK
ncbi:MAG: leucyl aminopeptidase [Spirochaetia bacterium]|nr:leucyl aminopeptidase [Spirochaetia bacterium]